MLCCAAVGRAPSTHVRDRRGAAEAPRTRALHNQAGRQLPTRSLTALRALRCRCARTLPAIPSPAIPQGPVDPRAKPVTVRNGRSTVVTLMEAGWRPPKELTTQALGLCFTMGGLVVLVELSGGFWTLPGGTVEPGEELEATLAREVREEACARVTEARYLASQHVSDPGSPNGLASYYQSRWWARVELENWEPCHETSARHLVHADELCREISWEETALLERLLELALDCERGLDSADGRPDRPSATPITPSDSWLA